MKLNKLVVQLADYVRQCGPEGGMFLKWSTAKDRDCEKNGWAIGDQTQVKGLQVISQTSNADKEHQQNEQQHDNGQPSEVTQLTVGQLHVVVDHAIVCTAAIVSNKLALLVHWWDFVHVVTLPQVG